MLTYLLLGWSVPLSVYLSMRIGMALGRWMVGSEVQPPEPDYASYSWCRPTVLSSDLDSLTRDLWREIYSKQPGLAPSGPVAFDR